MNQNYITLNNKNYFINDEIIRGLFDSDGNIYCGIRKKNIKNKISLSFNWSFTFEFASFNKETTQIVAKYLGSNKIISERVKKSINRNRIDKSYRFIIGPNTSSGKKLIAIYKKNLPLVENRLTQFLSFEYIYNIQKSFRNKRTEEQLCEILLILLATTQNDKRKKNILNLIEEQNFSENVYEAAQKNAQIFLNSIENKVEQLKSTLKTIKLSNDYMIGYTLGDGSFNIVYSINEKTNSIMFRPQWTITDPFTPLLVAFQRTVDCGYISSKANQFVLSGVKNCKNIVIPLFKNKQLPPYRQQQFEKFCEGVLLLEKRIPYESSQGYIEFIEKTYRMSQKQRKKTKEQYLEFNKHLLK